VKTVSGNYDHVRTIEPDTPAALHELLRRIESEYREMPGMCVTQPQAQRLWGLDSATCSYVLMTLIERGILRRTRRGTYVKC
jgi:predicted transcriptional regulator